ncbi:enoyl-CoA hydratase/isomerase family protein [Smaragdicoccus niigatensis]|uniref:enoyl-CoA hydratase/isomerase family protein n=1 Tax=Smaragdicoccus niigatensis TaxID=359359 RepID=UPI00037FE8A1|nr:enoyl-CoA hydratase/isomerase family protein [Smaragdicoccus niigatensis]
MPTRRDLLDVVQHDSTLHVWLNRPEARNALDGAMLDEIAALFSSLQTRFDVKVVVLGGRGPLFCAGADRRNPPGRGGRTERERRWEAQVGRRAIEAIQDCDVLTIARVHGHAIGGGAALALACDFRVGSEDSRIRIPEVELGMPLAWGVLPRLISEIGMARARELVLLCGEVPAARAEQLALLHRVVPADELDNTIDEIAAQLADRPEYAVAATKSQFRAYAQARRMGEFDEGDGELWINGLASDRAREVFDQ